MTIIYKRNSHNSKCLNFLINGKKKEKKEKKQQYLYCCVVVPMLLENSLVCKKEKMSVVKNTEKEIFVLFCKKNAS